MIVIPAIDLRRGKAVRLAQGQDHRATVYDDVPTAVLQRFIDADAKRVHVVDLDGAFTGAPQQGSLLQAMLDVCQRAGTTLQVGGGLRSQAAASELLDRGVDYVVIGTLALRDPKASEQLCREYPGRVIVAIDARNGMVAVDGWRETSTTTAEDLGRRANAWGAAALLHTDISRDGLQTGPAVAATAQLQASVEIPVIASGGIGRLQDLDALNAAGITATVVGRALYEGAFTIQEALGRC